MRDRPAQTIQEEMVSPTLFREFVPTHTLPPADRVELARHSHVVSYQAGQPIFQRGETAKSVAYLLAGEVEVDECEVGGREAGRRGGRRTGHRPIR